MSKREELERLERRDELPEGSAPAPYHKTYSDAQALEKLAANHGGVQRLSALAALGARVLEILASGACRPILDAALDPDGDAADRDLLAMREAARSLSLLPSASPAPGRVLPQPAAAEEERRGS